MTIIVGLIDEESKTIYMGGDSAGVAHYSLQKRKDPKVFINGEFIIGYTSSFRMGQLLRFKLNPPTRKIGMDVYEYMCTDFIDAVRECFKEGGYTEIENNVEAGGTFLVGYAGRLFEVESDFQVAERLIDYTACGCGIDLALGSLHSTAYITHITPERRVLLALKAAAEFSVGVSDPFVIIKKEYNEE